MSEHTPNPNQADHPVEAIRGEVVGAASAPGTVPRVPSRPRSGGGVWWLIGLLLVITGVALVPLVRGELKQRALLQRVAGLTEAGRQQLVAGRPDSAESAAREALALMPNAPQAEALLVSARVMREQQQLRQRDARSALSAAERLVAEDDVLAALRAFAGIRDRPGVYGEDAVRQADARIKELEGVTATLRLPDDWPEDAVIRLDEKPVLPKGKLISGIPLGSYRAVVIRHGFKPPARMKLDFRGGRPVNLPEVEWQAVGGTVMLASVPPGAAVWHNGVDLGKTTPCSLSDVEVGQVTYVLKLAGHVDTPVSGEVISAETIRLTATLAETQRPPADGAKAGERREFNLGPSLKVAFRWCPPGAFVMGGTEPQAGREERPARRVELTQGFWLAETEFTQAQWEALHGRHAMLEKLLTAEGGGVRPQPDHPMRLVSWDDICGNKDRTGGTLGTINGYFRSNGITGWCADLPTEAQWEYACRAGTRTPYGSLNGALNAVDAVAWHRGNGGGMLHPVGGREANPWGFRDMHGNISEWCRDWFQETYDKLPSRDPAGPASGWKKSLRGGSYLSVAGTCRAASRAEAYPSTTHPAIGFRLMLRHADEPAPSNPKPPVTKPTAKPPQTKKAPAKKPAPKKAPAK